MNKQRTMSPTWRIITAHLVTFQVLASYLWLRFRNRNRQPNAAASALHAAHCRNAQRIYHAIVSLQGLYIKVGQLFSVLANFLPEAFRCELAGLQDQVPPRPYEAIEQRLREEFDGRGPTDLFQRFDEDPIASASIGQVHVAVLPDGRKTAVKVQYPGIEQIVRADLKTLRRIFRIVQRFIPYGGMDSIYEEIRSMVLAELDFTAEAAKAEHIASAFGPSEQVRFPKVIHELTTRRVLTTEFIDGVKINDLDQLARLGVDRTQLARLVVETYCHQIFDNGMYHADPHPGNILVSEGPVITFVDFGSVGVLSESMRHGLAQLIRAALNRDTSRIITALREMGFIAHTADPNIYDRVIDYFHARFQSEIKLDSFNLKDIHFDAQKGLENIADLRQMEISLGDITSSFHVPKEWIMLERTILILVGLCTELDPNLNPTSIIRPHVERMVLGEDGDWSTFMLDTGREIALSVLALPAELKKFVTKAMQGDLQVRVVGKVDNAPVYYALGHQMIFTALGIACGSAALHFHEQLMRELAVGFAGTAGAFGLLLLRSLWSTRNLLNRRR